MIAQHTLAFEECFLARMHERKIPSFLKTMNSATMHSINNSQTREKSHTTERSRASPFLYILCSRTYAGGALTGEKIIPRNHTYIPQMSTKKNKVIIIVISVIN